MKKALFLALLLPHVAGAATAPLPSPTGVVAAGHDSRIDLRWNAVEERGLAGYAIHRSANPAGPFVRISPSPHKTHVYSDFLGENGRTYYYRVSAIRSSGESPASEIVSATSRAMTDEEFLTSVQEATFRYFWDFGHPVSGLAREGLLHGRHVCTSGGTGMGLMTIMVGAERKFIPRAQAAERVALILRFLEEKAVRYHGAWSHWMNGATGVTIPFSRKDDGGDLVETSFLVQGILTVRRYFNRDDPVEREIRARATRLWERVEWDWYLRTPGGRTLFWHWSPNNGWAMDHRIAGWNECMITYLLAIASPTHPVPASCYYEGWASSTRKSHPYVNGNSYYGHKVWVGWRLGGPLFFTHYSFLGFDPRGKRDRFCNYFENNRNITLVHRAYGIDNPGKHKGYGPLVWGLTASVNPTGYSAHSPTNDNGTITPTAAISAMPYTPKESIATMRHLYRTYGKQLWGEFGFRDAFNLDKNWFAPTYLAIDQGTIVPMIENYRTQLCWNAFMSNPEIPRMLKAIGWTVDAGP